MPQEWRSAISRWSSLNRRKRNEVDKHEESGTEIAPSRNDEYLLYQILLSVWPFGPLGDAEETEGNLQARTRWGKLTRKCA